MRLAANLTAGEFQMRFSSSSRFSSAAIFGSAAGYSAFSLSSTLPSGSPAQGNIRYRLKTPYRDGTTDVVFEPLDFIARLAAVVPTPRVNTTRYHGVFAPSGRFS